MSPVPDARAQRFAALYEGSYGAIHSYAARRAGSQAADEIAADRAGQATIRLRFATRFLRALARARNGISVTITAVSSAPGTKSVTLTRRLILRR